MSTPRASARTKALAWLDDEESLEGFLLYEKLYSELPRRLFLEIGLALARKPVHAILDASASTGHGLTYLRERLPNARLVGLQSNSRLFAAARAHLDPGIELKPDSIEDFSSSSTRFNLIYNYSALRLYERPISALQSIVQLLAPGGLAYVLDLRSDVTPELRDHLISRLETPAYASFLTSQLDSAYTVPEIGSLAEQAGICSYRLAAGGLAGYPVRSAEAYALLQQSDGITRAVFQLASSGFKSSRAADLVAHLFIRREFEEDHAARPD